MPGNFRVQYGVLKVLVSKAKGIWGFLNSEIEEETFLILIRFKCVHVTCANNMTLIAYYN